MTSMHRSHTALVVSDWFDNIFLGEIPKNRSSELHSNLQGYSTPCRVNRSLENLSLTIGKKTYERGIAVHGVSEIMVTLDSPASVFTAEIGRDQNPLTIGQIAGIHFNVNISGNNVFRSGVIQGGEEPLSISVPLEGATEFTLRVDGLMPWGHGDWAEAQVELTDGRKIWLDELPFAEMRPVMNGELPFSFMYDGKTSRDILETWTKHIKTKRLDDNHMMATITMDDPETGLRITCEAIRYDDYSAVEWVVYFENLGRHDTAILENIRSMDIPFGPKEYVLHYAAGSSISINDFEPRKKKLSPNSQVHLAPEGGRSSGGTLPFFGIESSGGGVIGAIGWSGQWAADFVCDENSNLVASSGMELTHLRLHPGERIRTPRQLIFLWRGDRIDGHNEFRRLILKHYTPHPCGQEVTYPISWTFWGMTQDTTHIDRIKLLSENKIPIDVFWIDAGWYGTCTSPQDWYTQSGNWQINPELYPNGMKSISDAAHDAGYSFLLWFDPERVYKGTDFFNAHPEWMLRPPSNEIIPGWDGFNDNCLLNMGDEAARIWITERMSEIISAEGIDIFREDYNIQPLQYWRAADAPDRQGITEIKYIEGFYAFWDELLKRHPGLIIDNCASGGQRIDIETMSRSIPLWRSDLQCSPDYSPTGSQSQTLGLSFWIPLHSCGCTRVGDTYDFRSILSAGVDLGWIKMENPEFPFEWARKCAEEAVLLRPFFYGDMYPLTEYSISEDVWLAYQLHRPDLKQGVVIAFRRSNSPYPNASFTLRALSPHLTYTFTNLNTYQDNKYTGEALIRNGLDLNIMNKRDSLILLYTEE